MAVEEGIGAREWLMAIGADPRLTPVHLLVAVALAKGEVRVDDTHQAVVDGSIADLVRLGYLADDVSLPDSTTMEEHLLSFRDPRRAEAPSPPKEGVRAETIGGRR